MARQFLSIKALSALLALHASPAAAAVIDYVIVGGGPAGLVVAEQLSSKGNVSVVVLEAGPDVQTDPAVETPGRLIEVTTHLEDRLWNYFSQPDDNLAGNAPELWQAKALGGGTAVNSMTYCRGAASVFDEWAEISGNSGLAWDSLLADFKATAHYTEQDLDYDQVVDTSVYGNGPLEVTRVKNLTGLEIPITKEMESVFSLPEIDMTDGTGVGVDVGLSSIKASNRTRSYAGNTYTWLMGGRSNVQILSNSWVQRIGFDEQTAVNVTYINTETNEVTVLEAKEIILAAGALNTPKLLLQSGVGPKDNLTALNIEVVADVPGIGAKLYDHHASYVQVEVTADIETMWQYLNNATETNLAVQEYAADTSGPLSGPFGEAYGAARLPDSAFDGVDATYYTSLPSDRPHVLWHYSAVAFFANSPNTSIVSLAPTLVQPEAHGYLTIDSADYTAAPLLFSNYYGSAADKAAIIYGVKQARAIFNADSLSQWVIDEVYPGPNVTSDDAIWQAIQAGSTSFHHPVGTVPLGDVLGKDWRVTGLKGLRVVDSSAMPTLPSCHIQGPVYAFAHRAAQDIMAADGLSGSY
ncbi:choline dehydrogenase [Pestalotiopsis sp. NC0098]|nr:choline dehydrogenase [Pestalotiopsis sp. NC0098]